MRPNGLHTMAQPVVLSEFNPKPHPAPFDERDVPLDPPQLGDGAYSELMFRKALGMGKTYAEAREYAAHKAATRHSEDF